MMSSDGLTNSTSKVDDYSNGQLPANSLKPSNQKPSNEEGKTGSFLPTPFKELALEAGETPVINIGLAGYEQLFNLAQENTVSPDYLLRVTLLALYYDFPREGVRDLLESIIDVYKFYDGLRNYNPDPYPQPEVITITF